MSLPLSESNFISADLGVNAMLAVLLREDIFAYVSLFFHFFYYCLFLAPVFIILDTLVRAGHVTNPMSSKRSFNCGMFTLSFSHVHMSP